MALFPKARFKWREPKEHVASRDDREKAGEKWWRGLPWVVATGAAVLPTWYLATLNPKKHPPSFEVAVLLAACLGVFLVYGVPRLIRLCPSEVKFFDETYVITRGNRHRIGRWSDVSSYNLESDGSFTVLRLNMRQGRTVLMALEKGLNPSKLIDFFIELDIPPAGDGSNPCA